MPSRIGNTHPNIVPYQVFDTKDFPVIVAVGNDQQFARFCAAIGKSELATDSRFVRNQDRVVHRETLVGIISQALQQQSSEHWLDTLLAVSVPVGPVNDLQQVFDDPQIIARQMCLEFDTEDTDGVRVAANPIVFSE